MNFKTADLCDRFEPDLQLAAPVFRDFGGRPAFCGYMTTVKLFEDNALVRKILEAPGAGRVLVVDGGGSLRCALVGDNLAKLAFDHGWAGIVVNGCIRDAAEIAHIKIGVKALATSPQKSIKTGKGEIDVVVRFAEATFIPGHYLYSDADGIILAPRDLLKSQA